MLVPKKLWGWIIIAASIANGLLSVSGRAEEKLLVAYGGHNENVAPMWVGIEKGTFKKYGLDVSMLQVRSGPMILATLASGSVGNLACVF